MLVTEIVTTRVAGRNITYFKSLGYFPINPGDVVNIYIEDLNKGSHSFVTVNCDYCKRDYEKPYKTYLVQKYDTIIKKDCCVNCIVEKTQESMLLLHGVNNCMKVEDIKTKNKESILKNYPKNSLERKILYDHLVNIWHAKTDEQKQERKDKIKNTNLKKYGVVCALELESSRKKLFEILSKGSIQQLIIYNMVSDKYGNENVKYNFYFSKICLDIYLCINDIKIDIEYDSWYWHTKIRDRRRDEFLKNKGFKILRIKSGHQLPNETDLFLVIDELINTERKYKDIILSDWNEEKYDGRVEK